jgi:hypothetical protein
LSLSDSNKSFSSASLGHGGASAIVRRLWCLISFGSTTSALNNNRNGGEVGGSADRCVVTPYCPWHDLCPFSLLLTFEYFLDCLKNQGISLLNCSVGLQVVYICEGDLRPDLVTEILERGTIKILDIIDGDLLRDSVAIDDVLPEKFLDCGGGYISYKLHFNPFGEVLHCDDGEGVIFLRWCKFVHDIDAPPLQGLGWSYQLRQLCGSPAAIR